MEKFKIEQNNQNKPLMGSKTDNKARALFTYGVNILSVTLPFAAIYHMTHTVSQNVWGSLAMAQSYSTLLSILVEYGFIFSASRALAGASSEKRDFIVAEVLSSKILLSILAIAFTLVILIINKSLEVIFFIPALFYAIFVGHSPIWYFQMTDKLNFFLLADFIFKGIGILTIVMFITSDSRAPIYLLSLTFSSLLSLLFGYSLIYKETNFIKPTLKLALSGIYSGFHGFSFRFATAIYTNASAFILGLSVSPNIAAAYFNAEKIISLFRVFSVPINQLVFPKLSRLAEEKSPVLIKQTYQIAFLLIGFLSVGAIIFYVFAPFIIKLIFGEEYDQTIFILRGMLLAVPFIAMNAVIGGPLMGAINQLSMLNGIILSASFVGVSYILIASQISWQYTAYTIPIVELFLVILLVISQILKHRSSQKNQGGQNA